MRMVKKEVPSLLNLCVHTAIDNVRYLGNVGETDMYLLERILPHCTVDQLDHIENRSKGRDLSQVTNKLWKRFYESKFGVENTNDVVKRMKQINKSFKWRQLYQAKLKAVDEAQEKSCDRIAKLYKEEHARKKDRQVQFTTKVPSSGSKRSFWQGNGSGISNSKSNIMKKAKIDYLNSHEIKNLHALKNNSLQKRVSPMVKQTIGPRRIIGSATKLSRPTERRW